ncbi:phytoalexin-deficient 4-1 protein [Striga asiatica]|uniref:Phytoalexin-deficient 4-1 protein n=1 Tax=Striga asiatica TaxID=4170 RepID=A0A5A7P0G0_STRAF|nr:phytoalexin-deficient 4-1 protein [Striga asiatica]
MEGTRRRCSDWFFSGGRARGQGKTRREGGSWRRTRRDCGVAGLLTPRGGKKESRRKSGGEIELGAEKGFLSANGISLVLFCLLEEFSPVGVVAGGDEGVSTSRRFESSEMLAAYLASTPLLEESWRQCRSANAAAQLSFAVDRVGTVAYVAFSGVQVVDCAEESCWSLVDLESGSGKGIFGPFCGGDEEEPVMVHGRLLRLFLSFYHTHNFQQKFSSTFNFDV